MLSTLARINMAVQLTWGYSLPHLYLGLRTEAAVVINLASMSLAAVSCCSVSREQGLTCSV